MEKRKRVRNIEKQNSMFLTQKNRFFSLQSPIFDCFEKRKTRIKSREYLYILLSD
jgi:hypothetical protein